MKSTPSLEAQRQFYDKTWTQMARAKYRHQHLKNRIHAITCLVTSLSLDQPRMLEIGCGLGAISRELARFGELTAMDLSPKAIEIAQRLYPEVHFFAADVMTYSFPAEVYDVVVTSEVIEHLPVEHRERFICILAEILAPGGYLIMTTPDKVLSDQLDTGQPIEQHFFAQELRKVLWKWFDIGLFSSVHRVFPVLGHRSKFFQALRFTLYEVLRLRSLLENPFKTTKKGLYFVVLAQKRPTND